MKTVLEALTELDEEIDRQNKERENNGMLTIAKARIRILGQMSLLLNKELATKINLFTTQDVDALIQGDSLVTTIFRDLLEKRGLQFDFHSTEIWIPSGETYIEVYAGYNLNCEILDPVSVLISKAIKAPEKNRALIREALIIFGEPLAEKIIAHGGKIEEFERKSKISL